MAKNLNIYWAEDDLPPYSFKASAEIHSTVNLAILGQLIKSDDGINLSPGLLEIFEFDFEKNIYRLKLKKGIRFHNGRTATSKDLEFTLLRGFFSSESNFYNEYLGPIKGISKIKKEDKFKSGIVEGVKIIDDYTVEVGLDNPNPSFFHSLSSAYFSLVPMEALNDDYLTWKNEPIGAGDYKVSQVFNGSKTVLERVSKVNNPSQADNVIIFSQKPDSDIVIDISFRRISNKMKSTVSKLPVAVRLIDFSNQNDLSKNKNFRLGMKHLFSKSLFNSDQFGTNALDQFLPHHFWGREKLESFHNLELAKKYFSKIPKEIFKNKISLMIYCAKDLSDLQKFFIEGVKKQLNSIGIELDVFKSSNKFVSKELASKYPLRMTGLITDYVDPLIMFSGYLRDGYKPFYIAEKEVQDKFEKLYQKASLEKDFEQKNELVRELSRFTTEEVISIPLAEEKMIYYFNSDSVKSLGNQNHPLTLYINKIVLN